MNLFFRNLFSELGKLWSTCKKFEGFLVYFQFYLLSCIGLHFKTAGPFQRAGSEAPFSERKKKVQIVVWYKLWCTEMAIYYSQSLMVPNISLKCSLFELFSLNDQWNSHSPLPILALHIFWSLNQEEQIRKVTNEVGTKDIRVTYISIKTQ